MCKTNDGFKVAEADLKMRGPGDFFSQDGNFRQSGGVEMPFSSGITDEGLLSSAVEAAVRIAESDPDLSDPRHARLLVIVSKMHSNSESSIS